MTRVLIDGRFVGVGDSQTRYVLELVRNILALDKEIEYTLLLRPAGEKELKVFSGIEGKENLKIEILDIPHYSVSEQTKLLKYLNMKKYDLVHFTQFNHPTRYKGNFVITIHDLTLIGHLHRQNPIKRFAFGRVMRSAVKNSKKIIAISKTTKNDILDYYKTDHGKIEVIYHGIDHERFNTRIKDKELRIKQFKEKYKIDNDYILYTGMWKKHKNLLRLLKAYEILIQNSESKMQNYSSKFKILPQLVLVGKEDPNESEIVEEIKRINKIAIKQFNNEAIRLTGFIEDEELPIAYAGAAAYCIPSLSEGFGWPPLEAMACGTPVISSKESCMPEILGDAALYFDPYNIKDLSGAIEKILKDQKLRKELTEKGLLHVQKYQWKDSAKKTLAVYKKLLENN